MGSYDVIGTDFFFGLMKKFWKWIVVKGEQHCQGT